MKRSDNMVIPTLRGYNRGINPNHSYSVRGHFRPLDNHLSSTEFVWPDLLHIVGRGMGEGINTSNLRSFRLSYRQYQGETK
jgi:hypothetical protein